MRRFDTAGRHEISLREVDPRDVGPGMTVLDLGCGEGRQMEALATRGCRVVGIDPCPATVARCRRRGLNVIQASGESLPFADGSFDAVVSRVVLPYTDERRVVSEMARVVRTGGIVKVSCHGVGYHVYDALEARSGPRTFYALRSLVNAHVYRWTGRRLPGFLGDTLYQSRRAMQEYFRDSGLVPLPTAPHEMFCGLPVFLYFAARKVATGVARGRVPDAEGHGSSRISTLPHALATCCLD
jgi:SAM-dependent methyltransferase